MSIINKFFSLAYKMFLALNQKTGEPRGHRTAAAGREQVIEHV